MVTLKELVLLLCIVACSGLAQRRSFGWLFPSEEPAKRLPIYKVHHYTGIHLQPLFPGDSSRPSGYDVPEVEGGPPDVLQIPEGEYDEASSSGLSGVGSLVSLLPSSSGLYSGAFGLSRSSVGSEEEPITEIDRIGYASKKKVLENVKNKKIELLTNVATGAIDKTISKVKTVSNILKGNAKQEKFNAGIYRYVPVNYPIRQGILSKIPFLNKIFGYGSPVVIPEIHLPYLPQLVSLPDSPNLPHINLPAKYELPYKTGTYVKVKIPKTGLYGVPSTPHGEPDPDPPSYSPAQFPEEDIQVTEHSTHEPHTTEATSPLPPKAPVYVPPPPPIPDVPRNPVSGFNPQTYYQANPLSYPYISQIPDYIPPPPPLPGMPHSNIITFQTSQPVNLPYPSEGYSYPQNDGFFEDAGPENEVVLPKPNVYPFYRDNVEPVKLEGRTGKKKSEISPNVEEQKADSKEIKDKKSENGGTEKHDEAEDHSE